MVTALGANLLLAAIIIATRGAGISGTSLALDVTARMAFLWFWAAYTGGALSTLFGPAFLPLKRLGRELGLAFAAALLVHLALVAWRCWIGAAPSIDVFVFFGPVAALTFILALLSFGNLHTILGAKAWQLLRTIGMNVIFYAFLKDFMQDPLHWDTASCWISPLRRNGHRGSSDTARCMGHAPARNKLQLALSAPRSPLTLKRTRRHELASKSPA
jgi:hypothetical protein